jgi:hypothetical protein
MGTPRQTRTGSLSAVEDTTNKTTAELAEGIETRLAEAVVELETLRGEVASLLRWPAPLLPRTSESGLSCSPSVKPPRCSAWGSPPCIR